VNFLWAIFFGFFYLSLPLSGADIPPAVNEAAKSVFGIVVRFEKGRTEAVEVPGTAFLYRDQKTLITARHLFQIDLKDLWRSNLALGPEAWLAQFNLAIRHRVSIQLFDDRGRKILEASDGFHFLRLIPTSKLSYKDHPKLAVIKGSLLEELIAPNIEDLVAIRLDDIRLSDYRPLTLSDHELSKTGEVRYAIGFDVNRGKVILPETITDPRTLLKELNPDEEVLPSHLSIINHYLLLAEDSRPGMSGGPLVDEWGHLKSLTLAYEFLDLRLYLWMGELPFFQALRLIPQE
jgi:hypothetical protein